ncbi:MAG: nuclear transport factor 2 family protein [Cyclobacteriaceae bacterium]|nr:nuclear transport factor 2 family protein [Cyclobacteriaceae bacterium]
MALLIVFLFFSFSEMTELNDKSTIANKLNNQAKCWNSGDIDCFMQDYWHHDSLMYIGKNGITYGWQNTLTNYKVKYPTSKEMGHLKFKIIKLEALSEDHYFMVGKWELTREVGDIGGHFTLIWKKINNEWVIISDHSS